MDVFRVYGAHAEGPRWFYCGLKDSKMASMYAPLPDTKGTEQPSVPHAGVTSPQLCVVRGQEGVPSAEAIPVVVTPEYH